MPILLLALVENGEIDFLHDESWEEAVAIIANPRAGERA